MQPQLLTVIKEEKLRTWTPEEWKKWVIQPKYDGARLIYHKGQFLSRTGKPLHNLDHIAESLKGLEGWTFDGEIYGDNWANTMSVARASKTKKDGEGLKFGIFDMMTDEAWIAQSSWIPYSIRYATLRSIIGLNRLSVFVVPQFHGISYEDFRCLHAMNLLNGCDGTVLKRLDSLYEFKRVKTWLKVKPVETYDCTVVGSKEGTGKYVGMLGALEILVSGITCFCSGMTDEQRNAWWTEPDLIAGKTIEVSARGVHPSGRLIEPRFIRIREDK